MPRSIGVSGVWLAATTLIVLSGCRTYEPAPLDPEAILAAVQARRHADAPTGRVELTRAVELARERSPDLLPLREAAETARVLGEMDTPLPNPSLSVGPTLLSGRDIESSTRWGTEAVGGWMLDLAGKRGAATDIRVAEADAARTALVTRERETYLALRRAFTRLSAARLRRETLEEVAAATAASERVARRLVEAAQATALDVVEIQVETLRAQTDVLAAREEEQAARDAIAALTGVLASAFDDVEIATAPESEPDHDELVSLLLAGHPDLDTLRAEYALAELQLKAEVLEQYPDLELEPGYEHEEHVDKYSLGFGFEIPIFDRNELGIEAAEGRRREVRSRFEAVVARRLTDIDGALARLDGRRERLALLANDAEPTARRGLALAESGLRGGALDGIRFLAVARSERAVRLDRLAAEQAVLEAWCDLEAACGAPLLVFASTAITDTTDGAGPATREGEER